MKKRSFTAFVFLGLSVHVFCQQRLSSYVNPFIGASTNVEKGENFAGLGKTFPGAATPFGLVQVSPNTITGGDNGSGYSYEHTSIEGFACTQMSGVGWYGDLGNFLVMPSSGPLKTVAGRLGHEEEGYRSGYDKSSEKASAGYYAAWLTRYDVLAELTAAPHSGMMRFTFPAGSQRRIQIDLARRVGGTSTLQYVEVADDHTIRGWMKCPPEGGGWGHGDGNANYTVFFYAQFSKPLKQYGVWSGDTVQAGVRKKLGTHIGFYTEFATAAGEQVLLKTGISFVSMEGAEKNLKAEIRDWNFDRVHQAARVLWDKALGKISIEGGTEEEKVIFYSALYHTLIDPRVLSDVDGTYPGGDGKPHRTDAFTKHSVFSGWDVFRSQMPLQTIINPRMVNDLIASLVELADQSGKGYLERWELINAYSGCMVGNPAVVVLADAYAKGIRDYDVTKAYRYAVNTCEKFGNKDGWDPNISVTLENGYSEWCLSQLAAALGHDDDRNKYAARAGSYRNIFDSTVHWFRPRRKDGSWEPWPAEGRLRQDYGTVESNPYQQGWFVPHDIPGMVRLMGGRQAVISDLQEFFNRTPGNMLWNNYYNHANEPVHHVPFLFNRLGVPWLTQEWSRAICRRAYHNSVEGLVGNEDVGQMSAWYVLAASGLHPVCPGDNRWEITSPVFEKVVMELDPHYAKGKTFTILAHNNSPENIYIQSARLNGRAYNKCWLDHADIMAGGVLELEMGNKPNHKWGVGQEKIALGAGLGNNMVVQQNRPFTVWGKAVAGSTVTIWADWMAGAVDVRADSLGNFLGMIPVPVVQRGDYSKHRMTISSGEEKLVLDNVLVGEVWFCSGQSNMQFAMKEVLDSTAEIAAANHPDIRLFNTGLNFSSSPLDSVTGRWEECSPGTAKSFSAVAYFFGRMLQRRLDVPVGLIFSGIGASAAQAYVPRPVLAADTQLNRTYLLPYLSGARSREMIDGGFTFEKVTRPFLLYNAMIHPFRHFSIRGICWYQGESNRMERGSYTRLMQTMIGSWREAFSQGELPFYYVQIAPFFYDKEDPALADEAFFREMQERVSVLGNTEMVISMDVGEAKNLHPKNKKPIGLRLARTALNRVYGDLQMAFRGPVFRNMEVRRREAWIFFQDSTLAGGLTTNDGKTPAFFTMAGDDHVFHPATAVIDGQHIVVRCAAVKRPVAVRYAFTNYPVTNLQNGEGLPAVPFRTDRWAE